MKCNNEFKQMFIRVVVFTLLILTFFSCESHRFDADTRQIMAKDVIETKLGKVTDFDITGFNQDTIKNPADSNFKKQIRYTLDIVYVDSNKVFQQKKGIVLFTPDGKSVIHSQITDR
jgi:uncharacterized membrane protein